MYVKGIVVSKNKIKLENGKTLTTKNTEKVGKNITCYISDDKINIINKKEDKNENSDICKSQGSW